MLERVRADPSARRGGNRPRRSSAPRSSSSTPATIRFASPTRYSTAWSTAYRDRQAGHCPDPFGQDPYNLDHPEAAHQIAQQARMDRAAARVPAAGYPLGAPPVFLFEPHQPERCGWMPEVILNITWSGTRSDKPCEIHGSAGAPRGTTTRVALQPRHAGGRNSATEDDQYAEAFQRVFPTGHGRPRMKPRLSFGPFSRAAGDIARL